VSDLRTTYLTYDDEQGIAEKGAYVRNNGLGGAIIWTISQGYLGIGRSRARLIL
jgi:chitinase